MKIEARIRIKEISIAFFFFLVSSSEKTIVSPEASTVFSSISSFEIPYSAQSA